MKLWLPVLPALMLVSQAQAGTVRVLLARQASVELRSDESLVVTPRGATGQWGEQAEVRGPLVAKPCAATVCAGSVRGTLIQVQTEAAALQIGARRLPNELSLSVEGGELRIIAELDIEVYLEGVLGREMLGVLGRETLGVLGREALGVLGRETLGVLGREALGVLGRETLGVLGREAPGVLGRDTCDGAVRDGVDEGVRSPW